MAETSTYKPVILAVDDDREVLRALERDLRRPFDRDYQVVGAESGLEALDVLDRLRQRRQPVALIVADQRMPEVSGVELLSRSREAHPEAKRVLLTAYADTEAAISAINRASAHLYLQKPWDPPDTELYPVLNDLLDDWEADHPRSSEAIRVVGARWSRPTHDVRRFLARHNRAHHFTDLDLYPEDRAGIDVGRLPLVQLPDGSTLVQPSISELAERIGLATRPSHLMYDLVVVGGGPAGLAAAVYAASEGLETVLVERDTPGGQAEQSARIENYLGFPSGLSGADLARRATVQAKRFGTELLYPAEAVGLKRDDPDLIVVLSHGEEVTCSALVIATGVSYRTLKVPGAEHLAGAGLYYGASRIEAKTHRDEDVFVVGGGNSAGQAALFLAGFAASVTILVRSDSLEETMSRYLIDALEAVENVHVSYRSETLGLRGEERLESVLLLGDGEEREQPAGALFVFIGQAPRTEWVAGVVDRDDHGFILSGPDLATKPAGWSLDRSPLPLETSVPGAFVAGDVRHGSIKRVASATGEGAMAVKFVHEHLAAP